jgi:hypothetical protein
MSAQTAVSTVQPFKEKKLEEDNKSMRDLGKFLSSLTLVEYTH